MPRMDEMNSTQSIHWGWATLPQLLLLIPLIASPISNEVDWSAADFAVASLLLACVGTGCVLVMRTRSKPISMTFAGAILSLGAVFLWIELAVGLL